MTAPDTVPFLLVTANVGSIFEDASVMLKIWTEEFISTVVRLEPKFLALHCQEVGGKNYEESMKYVEDFVKLLMESEELRLFDKVRIYLDEDYTSAENFTALGNFYFIHESLTDVLIWDFKEMCFVAVEGRQVFAGDIEDIPTKEKSKFPQDFFPECKWSRKGFLRTRWNLNGTVFDLVNIHLFHDASNFVAMQSYPSEYTKTRQRALAYTLDRFHSDAYGPAPFFLFGDFNFRTDTKSVIQRLVKGLSEVKGNNEKNSIVQYQDSSTSRIVLTLGKKEFIHSDHQNLFYQDRWLKEYDKEIDEFSDEIYEFPIEFPPSYPFVEDSRISNDYMTTRCPAWCDRVLLSQTARPLVFMEEDGKIEYGLIGRGSCMGDHKPVYLRGELMPGAGRLTCCEDWIINNNSQGNSINIPTTIEEVTEQVKFNLGGGEEEDTCCPVPKDTTDSKVEPNRVMEKFLVKRVNSASVVEVKVGFVKRGSCNQSWRSRSVSVSSSTGGRTMRPTQSRVRLISALERSGSRYNSHHSSSEEEWFEEVAHPKEHKETFFHHTPRSNDTSQMMNDVFSSTPIQVKDNPRPSKDNIIPQPKEHTTKCCSVM